LPVGLVAAELGVGWPGEGGVLVLVVSILGALSVAVLVPVDSASLQ